jgi:CubicO group peptidase (beta-lactamase class C family)
MMWPGIVAVLCAAAAGKFAPARAQSIDSIFSAFASNQSPGCAAGAVGADAPLFARAWGMADLEHGVPLAPASVFYMASVSKQFTALSILLLEREGKLRLGDRARTYVPELPDYADAITIRHLLHHTSGLRDYLTLSALAGNPQDYPITERAVLNALARQTRLNFEPGAEHLYSNSGYVLLSIIVHRVSGRPLDEFARDHIFTPLGMQNTRFQHDHTSPIPGRAIGYIRRGENWRIANSLLDVVGDGGMYSTVEDMMRWAAAFERPEFAPLLARMYSPGALGDGRAIPNGYGMGLVTGTYRGMQSVSHGGALAGYRTYFLRLPAQKLTIVTLCNNAAANPARLGQMVADVYAPAVTTAASTVAGGAPQAAGGPPQSPPQTPVPPQLAQALTGVFYSPELDATYRIVAGSDAVTLEVGSNAPVRLNLAGPDTLIAAPPVFLMLVAVRDGGGRVTGLELNAGRVRDIAFTRR